MSVFGWLNDQLLRMTWLNDLVGAGVAAIGLDPASRIGGSVQFFVYDVIKIFILLSVLIFAISYVQSHFPPERTRAMLGGRSGLGANTLAALLGTLTPFCSCSSIPLFIGFTAAGLPTSFRRCSDRINGGRSLWRCWWAFPCMPTSSAPCRSPRRWSARV